MTPLYTFLLTLWEKSGLLTKALLIWACGPALAVYLALGYKSRFKEEIKAEVRIDRDQWAAPKIAQREEQISNIHQNIQDIKTDLRDMRNVLIGPRKDQ